MAKAQSLFETCCVPSGLIARVRAQFDASLGASRQCSYFSLAAAAAAGELLQLGLGVREGGSPSAFVTAYEGVLQRASAAKASSADEPFIETVYSPRVLASARAFLEIPPSVAYAGGPARHAAAPVHRCDAAVTLSEFRHSISNVDDTDVYDEISGGGLDGARARRVAPGVDAAVDDYWANRAIKLGTPNVEWRAMMDALGSMLTAAPETTGAVRVAILHRLVMAFTVISAGDGCTFLVLDSHAKDAGFMDLRGLERYIAFSEGNLPGPGGAYVVVTWATGTAPAAAAAPTLVFVYGTLMRGGGNAPHMGASRFVGRGRSVGHYAMFAAGVPFVHPTLSRTRIVGEVYAVDAASGVLAALDRLEGHPDWYVRVPVEVELDSALTGAAGGEGSRGTVVCAQMYANPFVSDGTDSVIPAVYIATGDFRDAAQYGNPGLSAGSPEPS
jgi:gamma-glutamylaminecyclotransferase